MMIPFNDEDLPNLRADVKVVLGNGFDTVGVRWNKSTVTMSVDAGMQHKKSITSCCSAALQESAPGGHCDRICEPPIPLWKGR